jgi:hypothetical protein
MQLGWEDKILVRNFLGKVLFGIPRGAGQDNVKMDLTFCGWEVSHSGSGSCPMVSFSINCFE